MVEKGKNNEKWKIVSSGLFYFLAKLSSENSEDSHLSDSAWLRQENLVLSANQTEPSVALLSDIITTVWHHT